MPGAWNLPIIWHQVEQTSSTELERSSDVIKAAYETRRAAAYQLKEIQIETANLKIAALSFGKQGNPPVIALHGWLDNAASFVPIERYLPGINLSALDFPGHGKSQHRSGVNAYHFIDYAADVLLAADALGLTRFTLLGHSLGAGVAALIAAIVPDRIERLAMVEGLAPFTGEPDTMLPQFRRHIEETCKPASNGRVYRSIDAAARARQKAGDMSLDSAKLIVERNLEKTENGYQWRTDRRLRKPSPLYLSDAHVKQYLASIECNALLIRSDQGIIRNWSSLRGREPLVKNIQIIDIDGGHHCHMDDPKLVARHLLPFLIGT